MRIILNGETCEVIHSHLDQILIERGYDSQTIVTALNSTFVTLEQRAQTRLFEDDRLEVLSPISGG